MQSLSFFPSCLLIVSFFFLHQAGFINNTLHSQQVYILNSKLPFNSLSRKLAPSIGRSCYSSSAVCCHIRNKRKQKKKQPTPMQPLCVLWANICTTSLDKQATLQFSYLTTLPWRHDQEIPLFCFFNFFFFFFEGSVQLCVPKSTWLPGRPFRFLSEWTAEAVQLWYLLCALNGLHLLSHIALCTEAACAKSKMLE